MFFLSLFLPPFFPDRRRAPDLTPIFINRQHPHTTTQEYEPKMLEDIKTLILDMADADDLKTAVDATLKAGVDPLALIDLLTQTLEEVGHKYERGEFFLSELIMAGYLANEVATLVKPHLGQTTRTTRGTVAIGTVHGDIHDIGKNIVIMMLEASGYEVRDLGVDVSNDRFVAAVKDGKPDVLGISALLTSTMQHVKGVLDALETSGLRHTVKVIVGGRPITPAFAEEIGADGYAEDSVKALHVINTLVTQRRHQP